jgi:hypothetical protein
MPGSREGTRLENLLRSTSHERLAVRRDRQRVDFSRGRIHDANGAAVDVPVCDLAVRARREQLALVRLELNSLRAHSVQQVGESTRVGQRDSAP